MFSGSSPRVWGQVRHFQLRNFRIRIIPTRMGTSICNVTSATLNEDHPHAYGDKLYSTWRKSASAGSSPRVWGQELQICSTVGRCGIIPTRMGTRHFDRRRCTRRKDHPHAYGDKFFIDKALRTALGSSPRVWGQECFPRL